MTEGHGPAPGMRRSDMGRHDHRSDDQAAARSPRWAPVVAGAVWILLWYFTPHLHGRGLGSLLTEDDATSILIESIAALAILMVVVVLHGRCNRRLFAPSKQMFLYALPVAAAIVLPLHYSIDLPLWLYMFWWAVSVPWQDYLTFGLLQSYIGEHLPTWATVLVVAAVFCLGHVVLIPDRFGPPNLLPALSILVMGLVFALLRARLGTLHLLLALHLTFYFVVAWGQ